MEHWSIQSAKDLYMVEAWGERFFSVNPEGNLVVYPSGKPERGAIDLKALVDEVTERGIDLPLLIRFPDILKVRLDRIHEAFKDAIGEHAYPGCHQGVYPIKVNQDRYLVESVVEHGRSYDFGLEVGSKPELMVAMAMLDNSNSLIICNGYKDEEYAELALRASSLSCKVVLVVEKPGEIQLIDKVSQRIGIKPMLGIRAKLSTIGAGHWKASGGDRSKFGLDSQQILDAVALLRERNMLDSLVLLHYHLGSQITSVRTIKQAVGEAARFYVELVRMGVPLVYLDVGGGLAVDYDGSQTDFPSSMNYTVQEYARDIVWGIQEILEECGVKRHPTIVTECGRATVAHHAVLVCQVLGASRLPEQGEPPPPDENANRVVSELYHTLQQVSIKTLRESFHDARHFKDLILSLFKVGHLSLQDRALAESYYWAICRKIQKIIRNLDEVPEDFAQLDRQLAVTYFCNFSLFKSLPDSWAIDHLFPIVPIHKLNQRPMHNVVLADITCDSDGKIDRFIDRRDVKRVLELHELHSERPYYLGVFLIGAYQEILGDLHNLFGDTHAVHVVQHEDGSYEVAHVDRGDRISDVLRWVLYTDTELMGRLRRLSETSLRAGRQSLQDSRDLTRLYENLLAGYTYLRA